MIVAEKHTNTTNAPSKPSGRVELYNGSTLLDIYKESNYLQGFNVERVGEDSKFFGFGVCHKLTLILGDYEENVDLSGANALKVAYGVDDDFICTYPAFKIAEITRDEAAKEYTITAYDALTDAADHTVAELTLPESSRTMQDYATAAAGLLGLALKVEGVQDNSFALSVDSVANLEGTESVRELLNDIAEATQTIYYINNNEELVFKRLDKYGAALATITNDNSTSIIVGETKTLTGITHATELGDNVGATTGEAGVTQYVRDNAFLELRDDIDTILDNALANVGGMTNTAFYADWFGNYLLEVGDKIAVQTEDGNIIYSYVLNDVIAYTGIVLEQTQWIFAKGEDEGANSNRLGEALRQTFAKVDKVNKRIDLVVSDLDDTKEQMASIVVTPESVVETVLEVTEGLEERVASTMTADEITHTITETVANGTTKITTETGFTFDKDGLTISNSNSKAATQIDESGMTVKRGHTVMLIANDTGVKATDLHAETYLIIGGNSRLEDYEDSRTACFWIG